MMSKKWKTFRKHCFNFTVHAILYVPSTEKGRWNTRSSRQEVFLRKVVRRICSKFTGEHPYRSAISIKLHSNFIEITFRHGCSPVNLLYIFRIPFLKNISGWLFLKHLKLLLKNETRNSVKTLTFPLLLTMFSRIFTWPVWAQSWKYQPCAVKAIFLKTCVTWSFKNPFMFQ